MENYLRAEEVAQRLGVSVKTVHKRKDNGLLPYYRLGRCVLFKESDVCFPQKNLRKTVLKIYENSRTTVSSVAQTDLNHM